MPTRPRRACTAPGCGVLVSRGRCDRHRHRHRREKTKARGYGGTWRKIRAGILRAEPMCRHCERAPATEVDHIVPLNAGGTNARANLQPLCKRCHSIKTATQDGGFGKAKVYGTEVERGSGGYNR